MADFGRAGMSGLSGAASGASMGSVAGPYGAAAGGVIGGATGFIGDLVRQSEEAKQRKRLRDLYMKQQREALEKASEQRYAAITGINRDPMFQVLSAERWDPEKARKDADQYINANVPKPTPDYWQVVQSLGQLGSTVGKYARANDLANLRNQSNQLNNISATGNPWVNYALDDQSKALEEMLDNARGAAWDRIGGW